MNVDGVKVNKRVQSETILKQIYLQEFLDSVSVPYHLNDRIHLYVYVPKYQQT
jgi:hypothetical protein